jgi:hypothetical protein
METRKKLLKAMETDLLIIPKWAIIGLLRKTEKFICKSNYDLFPGGLSEHI